MSLELYKTDYGGGMFLKILRCIVSYWDKVKRLEAKPKTQCSAYVICLYSLAPTHPLHSNSNRYLARCLGRRNNARESRTSKPVRYILLR